MLARVYLFDSKVLPPTGDFAFQEKGYSEEMGDTEVPGETAPFILTARHVNRHHAERTEWFEVEAHITLALVSVFFARLNC